jgi:transcriptional regulator with XRE-family HTH domain
MREPIKTLRERLQISQVKLGEMIGRSHQSVKNYESGYAVPGSILQKLTEVAASHGYRDLALEFSAGERAAAQPGETMGTPLKAQEPGAGLGVLPGRRDQHHAMLDVIYERGDEQTIKLVESNLEVFCRIVQMAIPEEADLRKNIKPKKIR